MDEPTSPKAMQAPADRDQPALLIPRLSQTLAEHPPPRDGPITLGLSPLVSSICNSEHFLTRGYSHWCERVAERPRWHRKQWEFCFIAQVLYERGMLAPNKRGLGFGVGVEPLPALFAAEGVDVLATDASEEVASEGGWINSAQWGGGLLALNPRGLCPDDEFSARVRFETMDMRQIPHAHRGQFDFTWSSCALEHLGSVEAGLEFLVEQGRCLKWGGVGVHTTELLLFRDEPSVVLPGTVLFCRKDLDALGERLASVGLRLVPIAWRFGREPAERYIDSHPGTQELHLRLEMGGYCATSIGLIIVAQTPP